MALPGEDMPRQGYSRKGKRLNAEKAKVKDLIEVLSLYPREKVDDQRVKDMIDALTSGVHFPPVVVEAGTMRIVDGVHRTRAYRKFYGSNHACDVIFKTYESDKDFFFDAVSLNAVHGKPLQNKDRIKVVLLASKLKIAKDRICTALSITTERMEELKTEKATAFETTSIAKTKRPKRGRKAPRGGVDDTAGGSTSRAWTDTTSSPSIDVRQVTETCVQQLVNFLKNGSIDGESQWLIGRMKELHSLIGKFLANPPKAKDRL